MTKTDHQIAMDVLEEMKAEDIVTLDVREVTPHFDHIIICTSRSRLHGNSIADKLCEELKKLKVISLIPEGNDDTEWRLVDTGNTLIHIMTAEVRERYDMETLWRDRLTKKNAE